MTAAQRMTVERFSDPYASGWGWAGVVVALVMAAFVLGGVC